MVQRRDKPRYMIGTVAEMLGIHPQTLRLYEREGLICPQRTRGNTRLYSDEDIRRIELILSLTRDLGVNLAGVEVILHMRDRMERMQREMEEMLRLLSRRIRTEIQRRLQEEKALVPARYRKIVRIPVED